MKTKQTQNGFSLLELAVVLGMILVLISIALPNFLNAQVKSDVAKAKGDILSLVVAMESYYLDWGTYPTESEDDAQNRSRAEQGLFWLTSPIAYIEEAPIDPFRADVSGDRISWIETGGIEAGSASPCPICMVTWGVFSAGPDRFELIRSADPHFSSNANGIESYNPTNGALSGGDIFQFGGEAIWIGVAASIANRSLYDSSSGSLDAGLIVDGITYLHRLPPPLD